MVTQLAERPEIAALPHREVPTARAPAVRTFLDHLQYVCQWEEVARAHAARPAADKQVLDVARGVAQAHNRRPALDAAIAAAYSAPILDGDLTPDQLHQIREALAEAVTALTVRDLIALDEFWALYRPVAALIPLDLPLEFGRGYRPLPSR